MTNDFLINSITLSNLPTYIGYITSGLFIIIGIIIIFQNRSHKQIINEEKKQKNKNEEQKNFNTDSIFKKIPDFSNQAFFETIKNELKEKLNLNDLETIKKEIIYFKEETDKYIIISSINIKYDNNEKTYTITSEKNKNTEDNYIVCPTCCGKIKDITLLRCKHCDSILPKYEHTNNNIWKIIEIK